MGARLFILCNQCVVKVCEWRYIKAIVRRALSYVEILLLKKILFIFSITVVFPILELD